MKRIICLLCTVLLALLPLSGCFLLPEEETPPVLAVLDEETAETYKFSYVTRGDLEKWASITCRFQSLQQEHLTFQYDGRTVGTVHVAVGDDVEPGQLLAELDNDQLDADLEAAETALAELAHELESARSNLAIVEGSDDLSWQTEQYQATVTRPKAPYTHKCTVCGRTDISDPELEFRYCSRCQGYHCYCQDHISNHSHIQ